MKSPHHLMRLARDGSDYRNWYTEAHNAIAEVCNSNNWSVSKFIDVLALTSPRVSVKRNVSIAIRYMNDGVLGEDVMRNIRASLEHYENTGEIRGPKTSAFSKALTGNQESIVLDTWMAKALGVDQKKFDSKKFRSSAERRIRYAAHVLGWTPAETQAAIWAGTLKRAGRNVPVVSIQST